MFLNFLEKISCHKNPQFQRKIAQNHFVSSCLFPVTLYTNVPLFFCNSHHNFLVFLEFGFIIKIVFLSVFAVFRFINL